MHVNVRDTLFMMSINYTSVIIKNSLVAQITTFSDPFNDVYQGDAFTTVIFQAKSVSMKATFYFEAVFLYAHFHFSSVILIDPLGDTIEKSGISVNIVNTSIATQNQVQYLCSACVRKENDGRGEEGGLLQTFLSVRKKKPEHSIKLSFKSFHQFPQESHSHHPIIHSYSTNGSQIQQ